MFASPNTALIASIQQATRRLPRCARQEPSINWTDPEYPRITLPFGTGSVGITFEPVCTGEAILGAIVVGGVELEASDFSDGVVRKWTNAIEAAIERDRSGE